MEFKYEMRMYRFQKKFDRQQFDKKMSLKAV